MLSTPCDRRHCGLSHVKTDILARYVKYLASLARSPSMEVVVLANLVARDVRMATLLRWCTDYARTDVCLL